MVSLRPVRAQTDDFTALLSVDLFCEVSHGFCLFFPHALWNYLELLSGELLEESSPA